MPVISVSARKLYLRAKVAPDNHFKAQFLKKRGQKILIGKKYPLHEIFGFMKDMHITLCIHTVHDIVNDQGFAIYYRSEIWKVFQCTAKQNDGLTSLFMLNVIQAKIFQFCFLEGHTM